MQGLHGGRRVSVPRTAASRRSWEAVGLVVPEGEADMMVAAYAVPKLLEAVQPHAPRQAYIWKQRYIDAIDDGQPISRFPHIVGKISCQINWDPGQDRALQGLLIDTSSQPSSSAALSWPWQTPWRAARKCQTGASRP